MYRESIRGEPVIVLGISGKPEKLVYLIKRERTMFL